MQNKIVILGLMATTLVGCSSVRQTLGFERTPPNEYEVTPSEVALEMPPDYYSLPAPQPGAPRPQEMEHRAKAESLLTGKTPSNRPASTTDKSFMVQVGEEEIPADIRRKVDDEAAMEKQDKTVLEHLNLKKERKGDAVKAKEEQKKLEEAGIPTSKYKPEADAN